MPETVLVVAAHPDDEVLGCGGTIARHAAQGDTVHITILAEGATARDTKRRRAARGGELQKLGQAAQRAADILGAASLSLGQFPDNRMDSVDLLDVVKSVEALVTRHRPGIVYTHHAGDLNIDHQCVHRAVLTACRPTPQQTVRRLLCFEVPSSTEWAAGDSREIFVPQHFVDISASLAAKRKALQAYAAEMRPWPHPRSLEAVTHLARWRGASIGREAAEAFSVARIIE